MDSDAIIKNRLILTAQIPNPGGPAEFAKSIDEQRASPRQVGEGTRHAGEESNLQSKRRQGPGCRWSGEPGRGPINPAAKA